MPVVKEIRRKPLASSMWVAVVAAPALRTYRLTCFRQGSVSYSGGLFILDVYWQFCQHSHLQWGRAPKENVLRSDARPVCVSNDSYLATGNRNFYASSFSGSSCRSSEVKGFCPGIGLEIILGAMLMSSVGIALPLHRYPVLRRMVDR